MAKKTSLVSSKRLQELIQEGIVDCYGVDEEYSGLMTMLEDELEFPFEALVVGEKVKVTALEWGEGGYGLRFVCQRRKKNYCIDATSIEWAVQLPEGYEWVEAYYVWRKTI